MSIATIEISVSALLHNLNRIKETVANRFIMAVVKANAYSHGKNQLATLLSGQVDYFGVSRLSEAIELRTIGIQDRIVLLEGLFSDDDPELLQTYQLETFITQSNQIEQLKRLDPKFDPIKVWFKLDTGMHRLGFSIKEAVRAFNELKSIKGIQLPINIATHLANGDDLSSSFTLNQIKQFDQFLSQIDEKLIGLQSIAASTGIFAWPTSHRDVVRSGIVLYGVSPFFYDEENKATAKELGLKPAMTFKSELIAIQSIQKGESVSYGSIWTAEKDSYLGVVAMGYGDGYPREIKANTPVWINGSLYPIVGRVCMDMLLVDLGTNPKEQLGDTVIFWGNDALPVEKIAYLNDMSPYELLTRLTSRSQIKYVE